MAKILLACGIAYALLYAANDVICANVWRDYSSASQTISELSAIGAPSRPVWVAIGLVDTVLLLAFGVGVWGYAAGKRSLRVTAASLLAIGVLGPFWPPMHLRGTPATLTDTMHLVFTAIVVPLILLAMGFGAASFGRRFRVYSIATLVVVFAAGALTSVQGPRVAANEPTPCIGVLERVNVGGYLVWVAVLAVVLLRATNARQHVTEMSGPTHGAAIGARGALRTCRAREKAMRVRKRRASLAPGRTLYTGKGQ
ncbi:MAG TPA: DUF998 domain-containing protein [Polyangiaceae bacterium]|nr:DUF998 domain-containing protein [Polyangiaceae bacterium]